jgi:hypothetical protein
MVSIVGLLLPLASLVLLMLDFLSRLPSDSEFNVVGPGVPCL